MANKSVSASTKATTGPSRGAAPSKASSVAGKPSVGRSAAPASAVPAMKKGGMVKTMKKGGKCC